MDNDNIDLAEEIRHLTSDEIEELYKRYLNGEKNSDLVVEYKINANPNKLIKLLPPICLLDNKCPYCDVPMYIKRISKSQSSWNHPPIECHLCNHKVFKDTGFHKNQCNCDQCVTSRKKAALDAERNQRQLVEKKYDPDKKIPIPYSALNFSQKLALLTLFRMQTNEDFDYILALDDPTRCDLFTPTHDMAFECFGDLFCCHALIVDPSSKLSAFIEEDCNSFHFACVRWLPNITFDGDDRSDLSTLYHRISQELEGGIQAHWEGDVFKTLFRIAREEVLQYLHVRADELKVSFSAENKSREVVNRLLQNFSVSEIYYFVKLSIENAHIYYAKGLARSKKHAGNTIPNKMLGLGERAINEQWKKVEYSRDSRAPRSAISKVFFDLILHEEDSGFTKSPGKHWEHEIYPRYFYSKEADGADGLCCNECLSKLVVAKMVDGGIEVHCQDCGAVNEFISNLA